MSDYCKKYNAVKITVAVIAMVLLNSVTSWSQTPVWGESTTLPVSIYNKYDDIFGAPFPGYRVFGLNDDYFVKISDNRLVEGYAYNSRSAIINVQVFDRKNFQQIEYFEIEGKTAIPENEGYAGITVHNGHFYIATTAEGKNEDEIDIQLRELNFEPPYVGEVKKVVGTTEEYSSLFSSQLIKYYKVDSENEMVEAFYSFRGLKDTRQHRHYLKIYSAIDETWQDYEFDSEHEDFTPMAVAVGNSGNFGVVGFTKNLTYSVAGSEQFHRDVSYIIHNQKGFESKAIEVENKYIRSASILPLEDGSFLLMGIYGNKAHQWATGFFTEIIGSDQPGVRNYYDFGADFIRTYWVKFARETSENNSAADPAYEFCESPYLYECEDGSKLAVMQVEHDKELEYPTDSLYDPGSVYLGIVLIKLDQKGTLLWKKNIYQNLNTSKNKQIINYASTGYYSGYLDGHFYLMYNKGHEEDKEKYIRTKLVRMDENGVSTEIFSFKQDKWEEVIRPEYCFMLDHDEILLYASKKGFEKVGYISLER